MKGGETNVSAWCRCEARRGRVCSHAHGRGMPCESDSEDEEQKRKYTKSSEIARGRYQAHERGKEREATRWRVRKTEGAGRETDTTTRMMEDGKRA